MFRRLAPDKIQATVKRLEARITERFPQSSLLAVARELNEIADESIERVKEIRRPNYTIRVAVVVLLGALGVALVEVPLNIHRLGKVDTVIQLIGVVEPTLGAAFFLGAFVVFLVTWEQRLKRARALEAIHELRSMAHVIDMHQLTKDPLVKRSADSTTSSSPPRALTDFELFRYFDYCSEMLSLLAKIAALYVQDLNDPAVVGAVDEIEELTNGLSRKVWQKIDLLDRTI